MASSLSLRWILPLPRPLQPRAIQSNQTFSPYRLIDSCSTPTRTLDRPSFLQLPLPTPIPIERVVFRRGYRVET